MAAKRTIVPGCRVRLLRDVVTRGKTRFRAGVVMTITDTSGRFFLRVRVRGCNLFLQLQKNDARLFEVVSYPEE